MEADVAKFLQNSFADAVVYDFAAFWVPQIAFKLGIPRYYFSIFEAWFLAFFGTADDFDLRTGRQKKPLIPLGFLPPHVEETEDDDCENWVPSRNGSIPKVDGSVLYIALGSEAMICRDQLTKLAHGLELSEIPFLWAFKLPDGFEERIEGRGIVWKGWYRN